MHRFLSIHCLARLRWSQSLGAGAAGALNMWYDADIDAVMTRTAPRPIPRGRISRREALAFGLFLSCVAVLVLGMTTNVAAAGLPAFTIFFYVVIYTLLLKRITPQNIVIGGAAGALPPVVGWASATEDIGLEPIAPTTCSRSLSVCSSYSWWSPARYGS